jgi:hypothetical protein
MNICEELNGFRVSAVTGLFCFSDGYT